MSRWLAALVCCAACSRPAPLATCDDDLRGAWRDDATGARWVILDHGATLEVYPDFDDGEPAGAPPGLEIAPRVIDLARDGRDVHGDVNRRYMRADDMCRAKAPARITACSGDAIELVLADPVAPLGFAPCTWGTGAPSHRERWRR